MESNGHPRDYETSPPPTTTAFSLSDSSVNAPYWKPEDLQSADSNDYEYMLGPRPLAKALRSRKTGFAVLFSLTAVLIAGLAVLFFPHLKPVSSQLQHTGADDLLIGSSRASVEPTPQGYEAVEPSETASSRSIEPDEVDDGQTRRNELNASGHSPSISKEQPGDVKQDLKPSWPPVGRPIELDLEPVAALPLGRVSQGANNRQWEVDIERANQIKSLDGQGDVLSLEEQGHDEHNRAAQETIAAAVRNQQAGGDPQFNEEEKRKILAALEILAEGGGDPGDNMLLTKSFVLREFHSTVDADLHVPSARFVWKRILGVGAWGVVFEVEPEDDGLKAKLCGQSLAMKVHLQLKGEDFTEDDVADGFDVLDHCIQQESSILERIRLPTENPEMAIKRSGIVAPIYSAYTGGDDLNEDTDTFFFNREVLFSPRLATDFMSLMWKQNQKNDVNLDAKLSVLKRFLMEVGHLHAAGQLSNDIKVDNILIDMSGKAFLSDLGGAASIGDQRSIWSPANLAPEHLKELLVNGIPIGTEEGEAWGAGMTAFMALVTKPPFEWDSSNSYSRMLFAESPKAAADDIDFTGYPSPAFQLRLVGVPEEWVCIITSLLQPDPTNRATVGQVLQAFPDIFR